MKHKIKQITLTDGKQIFYPSEEEVDKLSDIIVTVIVENTMTKVEYFNKYILIEAYDIVHCNTK